MTTYTSNCWYHQSYKFLSLHQIFVALHLPVSEIANVLPEGVYCCFTRATLFITIFTIINLVCSFKSMCLPSLILIGGCVRELHAHLHCMYVPTVMYGLRLFIVVLQEVHCYRIVYMLVSSELWVSITSPSFLALHLPVFMYCLRVFIVFLTLHCLLQCLQ